jgi:hypothetical protein
MYNHQGYNSARIPCIENHAQAKHHYENTKPIRGRSTDIRPLGLNRRYSWYEIVKKQIAVDLSPENPLGTFADSYAARLYQTDCVEWLPNGDVVLRVNAWKSPTTMGFMTFSLRAYGKIESASGKWYFVNNKGQEYVMPTYKGDEMVLRADEQGYYHPTVIKTEYKYKAKRKELNRIRKVYADFIEYTKNMLSIDSKINTDVGRKIYEDLGLSSQRVLGYSQWGNAPANRDALLMKIIQAQSTNDLDGMYQLATYCAYAFGGYHYRDGFSCMPQWFVKGFSEMLKYAYHKEVFEAVEQPQGIAFIDRNARYVG